ncbi:hypothetical protein EXU85_03915 [Spirosoma sp. KCTC 42546]|uniref:hypothetical protein n=1 Tax=Spirosoma sp. KCTC 42546 TaxID=2520506 RepID=UPI001158B8A7|nr:hypothetical protein [Spirosoma sp. KCTC 42546]QDK77784.1 hypothetical protein EXU85_03915 [Spirosoma sp. KCTC 42546]
MGAIVKLSIKNVIDLWFAEDTPIRQYKIRMNPKLWAMCQQVSQDFKAPSGRLTPNKYRKSDKVAFARIVLDNLEQGQTEATSDEDLFELAY